MLPDIAYIGRRNIDADGTGSKPLCVHLESGIKDRRDNHIRHPQNIYANIQYLLPRD